MIHKWLKVAEIKSLSQNEVKVYLLSPSEVEVGNNKTFVALRQDLSKIRDSRP